MGWVLFSHLLLSALTQTDGSWRCFVVVDFPMMDYVVVTRKEFQPAIQIHESWIVVFRKCVWTLMDPVVRVRGLQMWSQSERDSWPVHQRSRGGWFTLNFTRSVGGGLKTCICMLYIGYRPWLSVWWRRPSPKPPDVIVTLSGSQISSASVCEVISPKIAWTAEAEGTRGNNRTYTHGPVWRTRNQVSKTRLCTFQMCVSDSGRELRELN